LFVYWADVPAESYKLPSHRQCVAVVRHPDMTLYLKIFTRMKVILFVSLSTLTLLFSCSNNDRTKSISFKVLNDSLTASTNNFKKQNDSLYTALEQKLLYKNTFQSAEIWFPKAKLLQFLSDKIYEYVDTAISNLKSDFILNNADSLYIKLDFYKNNILRIDPEIYKNIKYSADIITLYFDSVKMSNNDRLDIDFSRMPKDEQMFILKRAKNNIEIIENKVVVFCNNKVG